MVQKISQYKVPFAIGTVWLFHIAALTGIVLGYQEWFVAKTPFNLLICSALLILIYPITSLKKVVVFSIIFVVGMLVEWLGVTYGLFFGTYSYGVNFGPTLDGVPYLIGVNWALLTFITAAITGYFSKISWLRILLGALLMLLLDYLMEYTAPRFDFWTFEGGYAGLDNYIAWFTLALLFQTLFHAVKISGNKPYSLHLFLAQFVFFGFLFLYL